MYTEFDKSNYLNLITQNRVANAEVDSNITAYTLINLSAYKLSNLDKHIRNKVISEVTVLSVKQSAIMID